MTKVDYMQYDEMRRWINLFLKQTQNKEQVIEMLSNKTDELNLSGWNVAFSIVYDDCLGVVNHD